MNVPFGDLKRQYKSIKSEIDQAIQNVLDNTAFVGGELVETFENSFAALYGAKYCLGVGNGTDALFIALKALGVGPGDEVITTACSWIATSETISLCGAKPVFVDIDADFYSIDEQLIESKITAKTKAIIPVHLYGQMANIQAIKTICDKHGLKMIEDCAQAHFATLNGDQAGLSGDIGTFSFYPGKNLGAYGDAGAVVTNNEELYLYMKKFARHGALVKHQHEIEGINSRLDSLQAAVLQVKLQHINAWTNSRQKNAALYNSLLSKIPQIELPKVREGAEHVYHLYVIRCEQREELQAYVKENGVQTAIHYPSPLPFLEAYKSYNYKRDDFPVSAKYQSQILSLPMFPELNKEEIEFTCLKIKEFYS